MKIFVSWSGELSNEIAVVLKKYLPCIVQSVEVFYSTEDIEKGENWDSRISTELTSCNYGIICLTHNNMNAPWVNFEAGAIAKALESRVTALMVDIKPSDIQGPLRRYQATKLESSDMFQLVTEINKASSSPLNETILRTSFDSIWPKIETAISEVLSKHSKKSAASKDAPKEVSGEAIEEILQLVRKEYVLLNSPEQLFPADLLNGLRSNSMRISKRDFILIDDLTKFYSSFLLNNGDFMMQNDDFIKNFFLLTNLNRILSNVISLLQRQYKNDPRWESELFRLDQLRSDFAEKYGLLI